MSNRFYKVGFYVLSVIITLLILAGIFLLGGSKNQLSPSETQLAIDTTISGDSAFLVRLDTINVKGLNSLTISPEEKHIRILADSVRIVKDSIDRVLSFMNDSIKLKELNEDQQNNFHVAFSTLATMKTRLDFKVDNERLVLLTDERSQLEAVIKKFDKSKEKLNQLTKRLEKLTSFIKTATDIFASAIAHNILVAPKQVSQ